MRKEIYLVRGKEKEDYRAFTGRMMELARDAMSRSDAKEFKVTLTRDAPPALSVIPFGKSKIAAFSVYKDNHDPFGRLHEADGFSGAFKVEEALPVKYHKTWPDNQFTPGACLLTLFHRKPGIDYDTFIDRWHNGHTPLSLKIHPLWHYNRNVVLQKLCDRPGWFDGIVEEHTRTRKELLNPFRFFGSGLEIFGNMISVYTDTKGFLDYKKIETYLTAEIHLKS
jgi:hypothetical protein